MQILPSSWATHHFWNDVQFYYLLGIVPPLVIVFILNVLYGEAELRDIPEGYAPEWWEYHRHPLTRLLAKNFCDSPVRVYERELGWYYAEQEKVRFDKLARKAQRLMRENADYKAWFYVPASVQGFVQSRYYSDVPDPTRDSVR